MMHQVVGWGAVVVGTLIVLGTIFSNRSNKETMTSLPIGLVIVVIGLWQLEVLPLGEWISAVTGVGQR